VVRLAESRSGRPRAKPGLWLTVSACALLVCMMVAGCSGPSSKPGGTITGKLSGMVGGPVAPATKRPKLTPIPGKVEILRGRKVFATGTVGKNGAFKVAVPAGQYTLRSFPLSRIYVGCHSKPTQIDIATHQVVRVSVVCMTTLG
jgi:hypothetical protein